MLLETNNLRGGYGKIEVLKGISFGLCAGEVLSVVGPNGCGKTTLFRVLLGTVPPTAGSVVLAGQNLAVLSIKQRAQSIAYIPQQHTPVFAFTVAEVVMMGRASHFSPLETPGAPDEQAALDALKQLGIQHLAAQKYTQLSGGQRQLVLIARAIAQNAKLLVMDEPGANLDYANQQRLLATIRTLAQQGYGVMLSTHNPEHPFAVANKVLMMHEGRTAAFGPPEEVITPEGLQRVYGIEMDVLSARDRRGAKHTFCVPVGGAEPTV